MCVQRYSSWPLCNHRINYYVEQCGEGYRNGTVCDPLDGERDIYTFSGGPECPNCTGDEEARAAAQKEADGAEKFHKYTLEKRAEQRAEHLGRTRADGEDLYRQQMDDLRRGGVVQASVPRILPKGAVRGAAGGSSSTRGAPPSSSSSASRFQAPHMSGARDGGSALAAAAAMDELPEGMENRTRQRTVPRHPSGSSSTAGPIVRDFGADAPSQHRPPGSHGHLTIPEETVEEIEDRDRDAYGDMPGAHPPSPRPARSPSPEIQAIPEPAYDPHEVDDRPYIEPHASDIEAALAASRETYAKQPAPEGAMADDDPEFEAFLASTRDQYEMGEGAEREKQEMEEMMEMSRKFAQMEALDRWGAEARARGSGDAAQGSSRAPDVGSSGSGAGSAGGSRGRAGPGPSSEEMSKAAKKAQALQADTWTKRPTAEERGVADTTHVRNQRLANLGDGAESSTPPDWRDQSESESKGKGKGRAD